MNNNSPRVDAWGTPSLVLFRIELNFFIIIFFFDCMVYLLMLFLLFKFDLSQSKNYC